MATNKKTTTETTTTSRGKGDFPKAYIRLRTVLDSLEMTALEYCLKDKNAEKRRLRAGEIEGWVMPVIREIHSKLVKPGALPGDCGDGYHNCGGVCVPYPCPGSWEQ